MLQDKRQTLRFPNQVSWKMGRWSSSTGLWVSAAQEILFTPKISVTKSPIIVFSSLSKYPNTYFHMNKIKRQVFSNKEFSSEDEDVRFLPGTCMHTLRYWSDSLVVLHLQELTLCCSVVAMHCRTYSGAELHWEMMIQPQRNISELKLFSFWKSWKFSLARSGKLTWKPRTKNTVLKHFYSLSVWKEILVAGVNISA